MSTLTHWERVAATLAGAETDHPPVSVWQHFPERDQTATALADVTLAWQQQFDLDFVKLMPPGDYMTIGWGAESVYRGSTQGTRETTRFPVASLDDWRHIRPISLEQGLFREVIGAARLVNAQINGAAPVLQTIFSPLTTAMKLSAGQAITHLRQRPDFLHEALTVITAVTIQLVRETLDQGATGIFFATQCASSALLSSAEYQEFGAPYDLQVLAAAEASRFTLLHLHGEDILFADLARYPVHAINWHDRRTAPTLAQGQAQSGRCVVGGVDDQAIPTLTTPELVAHVQAALDSRTNTRVMIGPGCVLPLTTTKEHIETIIRVVRG
jgi:uroporphyrinogen decarboxylase